MSDDGTTFTIDLPVTGQAGLDAASASVDTLAARLGSASKASVASAKDISAAEASYRKAEQAADNAAKALERVGLAAGVQGDRVRAAVADTGLFSPAAVKAAAKLRALTVEQDVLAQQAAKTKIALEAEAKALDKIKPKPAEEAKGEIEFASISRGLGKLGGPLAEVGRSVAEVGEGFSKLSKSLGGAGIYVAAATFLVAIAAALVAVGVAAVMATEKILAWGVGLADANAKAELLSEGMVRSVKGGQALNDKIDYLTKRLPLTREEISATAKGLADMHLRGDDLTNALQRTAIMAAKLKFGPDFQKQMLSLDEQSKVFEANIRQTFGGLKVEGLLGAIQTLGELFDADTASGRAMKVVFESLFQPLIDGLTKAGPKIERFFLLLEVYALKALILFKPHASVALHIGEAFAIVAAIVGGVLVTALGLVVAALAAPFVLFAALIFVVIQFKDKAIAAFVSIKNWLGQFSFADIGKAMIHGLADGIAGGGSLVLSAVKGVVMGAVHGAEKLLGIQSPSKVFAEIGMQTGAGMAVGVNRSTSGVQNALEGMTAPPDSAGTPAPATSSASTSKGSISVTGPFYFYGVEGADDAEARFSGLLTRIVEGDAAQLGAVAPG